MGLFSRDKHTSPSGHFSADPDSDEERKASHAAASRRRSSSVPRKSVDSARRSGDQGAGNGSLNALQRKSIDMNTPRKSVDGTRSSNPPSLPASPKLNDVSSVAGGRKSVDNANGAANTNRSAVPLSPSSPSSSATPIAAAHARSSSLANNNNVNTASTSAPLATEANAIPVSPVKGALSHSSGAAATNGIREEHAAPPHHSHLREGLSKDAILNEAEAKRAEHDHQYLEPVVHERRHLHEVEEVERHRVVDRHVHHVQMHVQPLIDERHLEVVHSHREVPVTTIEESHVATEGDKALLARLNAQSASTYTTIPHQRVRVDKGETQVTENVINHYHTIVMPVWQRDLHEYYRLASDFSRDLPSGISNNSGAPISLSGPPAAREGHKLVPDHSSATYEVEYINRQPASSSYSAGTHHHQHGGVNASVGGDRTSAKEHYPAGAQGTAVREATGLRGAAGQPSHSASHQPHHEQNLNTIPTGRHGDVSGVERGLEKLELGVAQ